jgi:DNA-binding transcriptional MerR regulator
MTDEPWTLEQLSDRVADLLSDDYDGQQSGRVRELPNGRTIRWYTTIGLVDRPLSTRGRVALYGRRHAMQLAAIKRLQARGLTLAEIQEQLLGATEEQLARVARPEAIPITAPTNSIEANFVREFWRAMPPPPEVADADNTDNNTVDVTVDMVFQAVRLGDSVTIVLDGITRHADNTELAELVAAAEPLLATIDRLGLSPRKERR